MGGGGVGSYPSVVHGVPVYDCGLLFVDGK